MKKIISLSIILACVFFLSGKIYGQEISGIEQCKKLSRGVNIIGYDSELWKDYTQGRFKEKYFQMIEDAGFSNIRINMHPFSHMDSQYRISDKWLETLDWAVKCGLEANLMIILDLHEFHAMAADPAGKKEMFLSFWQQVAPRYKDLPDNVVFEILNEPNGKLTSELWNSFLVEAIDLIRKTNPDRTLMIGPGSWNGIESLPTLVLPEKDRNIIVTVHFYHPFNFTHQGAPWAGPLKNVSGITWTGTKEEKEEIDSKLQVAAEWAKANGRPIYLGEFGAYEKADMDSRARYTAYVARTAERLGFSWGYWQFDSDFILYNIDNEEWVTPLLNALTGKIQE
jgi:endoglucanase